MSTRIDAQATQPFGRVVIIAAVAGLFGVTITLIATATLLLSTVPATQPRVDTGAPLEPGYMDYGIRQSRLTSGSTTLEPGYMDYGIRQSRLTSGSTTLEPGYMDYGIRHPVVTAGSAEVWPLEPGYDDYGQRLRNQQPSR